MAVILLLVSTDATLIDAPADRIDDKVSLKPAATNYSYLDRDNKLVVNLSADNPDIEGDGVNSGSINGVGEVFYITYEGDRHADVWIDHNSAAVDSEGDGERVDNEDDAVRLTPDRRRGRVGGNDHDLRANPWDMVAGAFVIRQAGRRVTDLDGPTERITVLL
ncbi:hypothetical protein C465_07971 [Halorubrum distributum JCM 9100]|uniref:DUF1102 domain-containing protein n=2 Tax=Halorubrum distributum TaxID=29283 RepID=M0ENZ5_9EURY|nr:hypothetical protein C465_07971 [Halorubrum distributum JCM 9100]ELZ57274.1 hypothetical protein C466_01754 [Halorubrum distributum JCM 10118]